MASVLKPMLAQTGELPDSDQWSFELKWDGIRAVLHADRGGQDGLLRSRNAMDITAAFPELAAVIKQLADHDVVLDGELVCLDDAGVPDFEAVAARVNQRSPALNAAAAAARPARFVCFDILRSNGRDVLSLPLSQRRQLLAVLHKEVPALVLSQVFSFEDRDRLLAFCRDRGLEGVMAKRLDSIYQPGKRSAAWRKHKLHLRQEFVVGGVQVGSGTRSRSLGALLVGYHDGAGQLRYAGTVGSGLDAASRRTWSTLAIPDVTEHSPFVNLRSAGKTPTFWVAPRHVCEVQFLCWTTSDALRQPVYKGMHTDRDPGTVIRHT